MENWRKESCKTLLKENLKLIAHLQMVSMHPLMMEGLEVNGNKFDIKSFADQIERHVKLNDFLVEKINK